MSNQFRIGGVYRTRDGKNIARFVGEWPTDSEMVKFVNVDDEACSFPRFHSGQIWGRGSSHRQTEADFLPGELVQVDGEWVSPTPTLDKIEAEKEEPIGDDYDEGDEWAAAMDAGAAALMGVRTEPTTPTLDKMEAEKAFTDALARDAADDLKWHAIDVSLDVVAYFDGYDVYLLDAHGQRIAAEPARPRLTWADSKPADRFEGFTVSSHTQDQQASNNHALQRCADFDGAVMKV